MEAPRVPQWSTACIPARVVVGVTGHRTLEDEAVLAGLVRKALERIKDLIPPLSATSLVFTVVSPLAEGADRLVAREVLKMPGAVLEAVLPLPKEDYFRDFATPQSRAEFEALLAQARRVKHSPPSANRTEAYDRVGRFVVDHCDVLIALWNGQPASGPGGTAEIVGYARDVGRPLMWIHAEAGAQLTVEAGRGIDTQAFPDLDAYCSEVADPPQILAQAAGYYTTLVNRANAAGYPAGRLQSTCEQLLPHYVRADLLAGRYQRNYVWAGTLVYAFALLAVMVAASQALFLPDDPWILAFEVLLMAAALATVTLGNRRRWHSKYIDYRFLAERFRSALFMAAAGVEIPTLLPPRHLSLAYTAKAWMVRAFTAVWERTPTREASGEQGFEALKGFLLSAWIDDQIAYHEVAAGRNERWYRGLYRAGLGLFGLTLVAAAVHTLDLVPRTFHRLLSFSNVVLPAAGSAFAAIRMHREYHRTATRSDEMVHHLRELRARIADAMRPEPFARLVAEAEETMLRENQDWRVVFRFHPLEPPA